MFPFVFPLVLGFVFWVSTTSTPWVDTCWIDQTLGLSRSEMTLLVIFLFVGYFLGQLQLSLLDQARAHDRLSDRVHGRSEL